MRFLFWTALALAACRHDVGPNSGLVGGRCVADTDCAHRCARSDRFPGGFCTVSCQSDADCPPDTACIEREGGVCLVRCAGHADCTIYGPYECSDQNRKGGPGKNLVCIGA